MARLPDRFDLWVRKARACSDPARQVDYILGALMGLKEWYFLPLGAPENPQAAVVTYEGAPYVPVFSDAGRLEDALDHTSPASRSLSCIAMPAPVALSWCVERRTGLLVNPGEDSAAIPLEHLVAFQAEWRGRGGRQAQGFWIPNLTSAEEDFWQEHGL